ncbi:hypothetical protein ARAM_003294 [Aspergillus rambellii]|uniref:Uncharacterized protein n=1 Tax=Aspergillus rambellii TaxID=308745 RepID=A0A0F8XN65_9EURO|nr:hypothetical protein ARAM_003294 [Aspergillus rambellii]
MCPMLLSSLRDGPAMVLSPPQEHAFLQFPCPPKRDVAAGATSRPFSTHGVPPNAFSSGVNTSFSGALTPSPFTGGKPSRKRSRDDVAAEDSLSNGVATTPAPVPRKEPIYGDGMVLATRAAGNAIAASRASQRHASESSRKSQRLDPSGPGLDDLALSRMERQLQQIDKDDHCRPVNAASRCSPLAPAQPLVDDATRLLGISWQRIQTDDTDLAAAIRGWKNTLTDNSHATLWIAKS